MRAGANEVEVKFYIAHLHALERRVVQRGGRLIGSRVLETNLRFDTPEGLLRRGQRALRLRRDAAVTLTYKGAGDLDDGIRIRPEAEVLVADLEAARSVLEGLGFVVVFTYEKFRTTYELGDVEVMLDELPYGDFVELEGTLERLRPTAEQLGLRWDTAIPHSYHALFEQLQAAAGLSFPDLTFANFKQSSAGIADLGSAAADA